MLTVSIRPGHPSELSQNEVWIGLSGVIDETVDFSIAIGQMPPRAVVDCSGITRVNSIGVRSWTRYFSGLKERGASIRFVQCSVAVVELASLISDFTSGFSIESFHVPFYCQKCGAETTETLVPEDVTRGPPEKLVQPCKSCGGTAELDVVPEVYFRFITEGQVS